MIDTPASGAALAEAGMSSASAAIRQTRGIRKDNSRARDKSRTVACGALRSARGPPADRRAERQVGEGARAAERLRIGLQRDLPAGRGDEAGRRRDPVRRRARGRQRDPRRPPRARDPRARVDRDGVHRQRRSRRPRTAPSEFAPGAPSDAVVWEQVEASTSENVELSGNFIAFMVLAVLIATAGHLPRLADPDHRRDGGRARSSARWPGLCVALVEERGGLALRSLKALAVGFPVGDHGRIPRLARDQGARPGAGRLQPRRPRVHRVHHRARTSSRSSSRSWRASPASCR